MDLSEDLKNVTFKFSFAMIYILHKMLVLLKSNLNYLKDSIFECFFKEYNKLLYFFKDIIMKSLSIEEENIIKDIKNLFRLEKNQISLQWKI